MTFFMVGVGLFMLHHPTTGAVFCFLGAADLLVQGILTALKN